MAEVVPADVANVIRPYEDRYRPAMMRIGSIPYQLRQHEPIGARSS
jgi:hypothetical protein